LCSMRDILDALRRAYVMKFRGWSYKYLLIVCGARVARSVKLYGKVFVFGRAKNIEIDRQCVLNEGVVLNSRSKIHIGSNTHLSSFSKIYTGSLLLGEEAWGQHEAADVSVGENCWVGSGAIVLGGVKICDNVVIGAGSVVTRSISTPGFYAGVPAKFVRRL
jgi:maltose O-acetyltransferase